jgi:hypothetical protein
MTDPVLEALREIAPATRGRVDLGGRTLRWVGHAVHLHGPALVAEAILGFPQ